MTIMLLSDGGSIKEFYKFFVHDKKRLRDYCVPWKDVEKTVVEHYKGHSLCRLSCRCSESFHFFLCVKSLHVCQIASPMSNRFTIFGPLGPQSLFQKTQSHDHNQHDRHLTGPNGIFRLQKQRADHEPMSTFHYIFSKLQVRLTL